MDTGTDDNVVLLEGAAERLRGEFVAWQCRIRQLAVRELGGRPTPGMRPRATSIAGAEVSPGITVLLNRAEPADVIKQFRYLVLKTQDPMERHAKALDYLASAYFQHPHLFSDAMTALFGPVSVIADRLVAARRCVLDFAQFGQTYRIPCDIESLPEADERFQVTYWHNRLFNHAMPAGVQVVSFAPDWRRASGASMGAAGPAASR
jgi:hypothetical protein